MLIQQDHPLLEVTALAPPIVTTGVQVPLVPEAKEPADAPPMAPVVEHPVTVYFVPALCSAEVVRSPVPFNEARSVVPVYQSKNPLLAVGIENHKVLPATPMP